MDPYEKQLRIKFRRHRILTAVRTFVLAALLTLGVWMFATSWGGFRLELQLEGPAGIAVRYGDEYEDPGCTAWFSGKYFPQSPVSVPVTTEGAVDTGRVGLYEITYRASVGPWQAQGIRKVRVVDPVKPKILLYENPGTYVLPGGEYVEEGYIARDNYDGDLTDQVRITRTHNRVYYRVTDSSGNTAEVVRNIVYYDPVAPEIMLAGDAVISVLAGEDFRDPGCTAWDAQDGDLTNRIVVTGEVNCYREGTYTLIYSVSDRYGNRAEVTRTVTVEGFAQPEIVVPEGKVIYLTFDDGPGPYTRQLLDVLKKYDVKATFFVVKTGYLDLLEDMAEDGHAIGIHSVSHNYRSIYASEDAYFRDLYQMQDIIEDACGVKTTLVRFPGGSSNTVSKFNRGIMSRLAAALTEQGFQYFDWNVNSGDAGDTEKTEEVVQFVIDGVRKQDVSIVLQHDIKKYSVRAVEEIILWGLRNGYRFLPLQSDSPNAHHEIRN